MHLKLVTHRGNIKAKDIHGPVAAVTHNGDIEMTNITGKMSTQIIEKGTINIYHARNGVTASTNHGNIIIDGTYQSVNAFAAKGKVYVSSNQLPTTSFITLEASGLVTLELPLIVNASIQGRTSHGTITSDHYITLKPYTTQLNNLAWNRFRQEVDGILGTGESQIKIRSTRGNVKITKTVTA